MSNVNTDDILSFLKEESEKNKKAAKKTLLIGGCFGLFLFGYLFWLNCAVKGLLNPEDLAAVVYGQVDERLPSIIDQLEREAVAQGPALAKRISAQLETVAPSLRVEGELAIDRIFSYLPVANEEMKHALEAFASEHKQDMSDLIEANGIEPFAQEIVDELSKKIAIEFEHEFREESGHDMTYLKVASLEELKAINDRLDGLTKKQTLKMSRSELIQKRLIALLLAAFDDTLSDGLDDPAYQEKLSDM